MTEPTPPTENANDQEPPVATSKPAAKNKKARRWKILAGFTVVAAALLYFVMQKDPLRDLDKDFLRQGFRPNPGLAGFYVPGTVIRLRTVRGGEEVELPRPAVALTAETCFPGARAQESDYFVASRSGRRETSLQLDASEVLRVLPNLALQGAKTWNVEVVRPKIRALPQLEVEPSAECLARLEEVWSRPDEHASWFATIGEAIVAEGLVVTIEWNAGAGGDVKAQVERSLEDSLETAGVPVEARVDSGEKTVYRAEGELVLAYSTWEMLPEWEE